MSSAKGRIEDTQSPDSYLSGSGADRERRSCVFERVLTGIVAQERQDNGKKKLLVFTRLHQIPATARMLDPNNNNMPHMSTPRRQHYQDNLSRLRVAESMRLEEPTSGLAILNTRAGCAALMHAGGCCRRAANHPSRLQIGVFLAAEIFLVSQTSKPV